MAKPFPAAVQLKQHKCPQCGEQLGAPLLKQVELAVQAGCPNTQCDFHLELFWIGDYTRNWN